MNLVLLTMMLVMQFRYYSNFEIFGFIRILIVNYFTQRTGHYMDSIASAISPALEDEEIIMDQLKE